VSFPAFSYQQAFPGATDQPEIVIDHFGEPPMLNMSNPVSHESPTVRHIYGAEDLHVLYWSRVRDILFAAVDDGAQLDQLLATYGDATTVRRDQRRSQRTGTD